MAKRSSHKTSGKKKTRSGKKTAVKKATSRGPAAKKKAASKKTAVKKAPARKKTTKKATARRSSAAASKKKSQAGGRGAASGFVPKVGQKVIWHALPGDVEGEVTRILTEDTVCGGKKIRASASDPRIELKSSKSGKICYHKPQNVRPA